MVLLWMLERQNFTGGRLIEQEEDMPDNVRIGQRDQLPRGLCIL
jgi:hypothetical protein